MSLEVNERLKFIRKHYDMTQKEFANAIGLSQGNVSGIEKGSFKPSIDTIISTSRYFDISTDWILLGHGTGPEGLPKNKTLENGNSDFELSQMCAILKELMQNPDANLRGWTVIQFKKAFEEYWTMEKGK